MDGSTHRFTTLAAAAAIGKTNRDVLYTFVPLHKSTQGKAPVHRKQRGVWVAASL